METVNLKKFDKCCCCIPLDIGAHILGIFNILGTITGLVMLIMGAVVSNAIVLSFAAWYIPQVIPAIAYIMMICKPTYDSKMCYANSYLWCSIIGYLGYYIVMLSIGHGNAGLVVDAFITPAVGLCFIFYFYFCLTSFADAKGFENFGYGAQVIVPGMYNQPMMTTDVNGTILSESDRATTLTTNNAVM